MSFEYNLRQLKRQTASASQIAARLRVRHVSLYDSTSRNSY
jgi:hypothetical protein